MDSITVTSILEKRWAGAVVLVSFCLWCLFAGGLFLFGVVFLGNVKTVLHRSSPTGLICYSLLKPKALRPWGVTGSLFRVLLDCHSSAGARLAAGALLLHSFLEHRLTPQVSSPSQMMCGFLFHGYT